MREVDQRLSTEDELFCTRYELDTLSGIVNQNRLERWLPGFCNPHTHIEHEARYNWVKQFVERKTVLDIACGTGFGTYMLAKQGNASAVTGWDIDEQTIRYASLRHKDPRLHFEVKNAELFDETTLFDVITSFETIEHLNKPEIFLQNIERSLRSGGRCFISTPISGMSENKQPDNPFHITEWGFRRFQELVRHYLTIDEIYLQLYKMPPVNRGIISRFLKRTGLKRPSSIEAVEDLTPIQWQPGQLREDLIGTTWTGFQVLQCSKKADAGR